MKVAVVGATGLVGEKMLEVLYERRFPVSEIIPVATERSVGKKALFGGKEYTVVNVDEALPAALSLPFSLPEQLLPTSLPRALPPSAAVLWTILPAGAWILPSN